MTPGGRNPSSGMLHSTGAEGSLPGASRTLCAPFTRAVQFEDPEGKKPRIKRFSGGGMAVATDH